MQRKEWAVKSQHFYTFTGHFSQFFFGHDFKHGGSDSKESACNVGDMGWKVPLEEGMATHSSILAWRIPLDKGTWQAIQFMGHKELDTTERLSTHDFKHGWKSKEMAILLIYLLQTLSWDSPVLGSVSYFLNQRSGPNTCNLAQKGDLGPKYSQLQSSWTNTLCAKQTRSNGNLNCR